MYFNNGNFPYDGDVGCNDNCLVGDIGFYSNDCFDIPFYDGFSSEVIDFDTNSYYAQQQTTTVPIGNEDNSLIPQSNSNTNYSYSNALDFETNTESNTPAQKVVNGKFSFLLKNKDARKRKLNF